MKNLIWIETDCPYFPGKNGHSFFLLKEISKSTRLTVIAPSYPNQPQESVSNLRKLVHITLLWPEPLSKSAPATSNFSYDWRLRSIFTKIPRKIKEKILFLMLGMWKVDHEEYTRLAILSNLMPYLWEAYSISRPDGIMLIQSNISNWLDWLPEHLIKTFYLHDVRSDYLPKKLSYTKRGSERKKVCKEIWTALMQEKKISVSADVAAFVSTLDQKRFHSFFDLPTKKSSVVPIPIDSDYFKARKPVIKKCNHFELLFTGHLSHPPNVDALHFFLNEIWNQQNIRQSGFHLIVAGCHPSSSLVEKLKDDPAITFYPDIPDIREIFRQADAFIVPMRFGGGVRQKILEAMAMELPIISTEMGMEGIELNADITTVYKARDALEFSKNLLKVKESPPNASELLKARNFVLKKHSLEGSGNRLSKAIETSFSVRRESPFRVLFDIRWMKAGVGGGIEQLARSLISEIARLDHRNCYRILGPEKTIRELSFCSGSKVSVLPSEFPQGRLFPLKVSTGRSLIKSMGMHPILTSEMLQGRYMNQLSFDMVHSFPAYIHPEFIHFPNILTFTDLQHLTYPQFFSKEESEERNRLYKASVEAAKKVLCISDFTKNELRTKWNVPENKLETVHLSASALVRLADIQIDTAKVLARFGLTQPFLFYPAHSWAHKNHAALLRSFQAVCSTWKRPIHLVVTAERKCFLKNYGALIEELKLTERVCWTGYVSELELAALYKEAAMLVFPSLFEGFGMPVLEAMHFGCPVACSNTTSLPEIADNAARYFDPESTPDMTKAILDILESNELRRHLVEMGNKRKMAFSWRKSAMKTLCCYHDVHENR